MAPYDGPTIQDIETGFCDAIMGMITDYVLRNPTGNGTVPVITRTDFAEFTYAYNGIVMGVNVSLRRDRDE